jgi:hypothetical protein
MVLGNTGRWEALEPWSPMLFVGGSALELVFAANNGAAYLVEGFSFVEWIYPSVLLGRLAVLVAIAGLSVQVVKRTSRSGTIGRGVLSLAIVFTVGLLTLSALEIVGISTPVIAVFGIGTVALTILTYSLFGALILRTGAYSTPIGGLLVLAAATVLGVLLGLRAFPTELVGAVGEGILFVVFLVTGYSLRTESRSTGSETPSGSVTD